MNGIPLHLAGTTVHVSDREASALVAERLAEWLPLGVPALRSTTAADLAVLARLAWQPSQPHTAA